jgi:hypothetical protein
VPGTAQVSLCRAWPAILRAAATSRLVGEGRRGVEQTIQETQRLGKAQLRAYVGVRSAKITFSAEGHPRIEFVAVNSGQSPARDLTWNATLRYDADRERVCRPDWRRYGGFDIAAGGGSSPIWTFVPNMEVDSLPGFSSLA